MTTERVYFIASAGHIKIGRSVDVGARVAELAVGNPHPLVLIGQCAGGAELEVALHRHLADYRERGEWFRDCPEVRAAIGAAILAAPVDGPPPRAKRGRQEVERPPEPPPPAWRVEWGLAMDRLRSILREIEDQVRRVDVVIDAGIYSDELQRRHDTVRALFKDFLRLSDRFHDVDSDAPDPMREMRGPLAALSKLEAKAALAFGRPN